MIMDNTIFSVFVAMSDMTGRADGSRCQHKEHISHHSSVIREQVAASIGRLGKRFCIIRIITPIEFLTSWNGFCRVKSSYNAVNI